MSTRGYCGSSYDRHVENSSTSRLHRMKETYWITKQAVIQKLGKKEDEHVVASDGELDTKLEVYQAIQQTTMTLLEVLEKYQNRLCAVAQEENAMGRFLKSHCSQDKTRAGKMMAAVGKSQSASAQERLALRAPLVRLYQDVETFRYRAISDTLLTVHRMEGARTEYRGALLWMKKVSEELDPDTYRQLEKFRKVQGQVRKTKQRFDKLKLDVMQKIDLLAASRCNMFSHDLATYQSALLLFWQKTSTTMAAVAETFKGYQYYEFNMLKELRDTSRKLAEESSSQAPSEHLDISYDTVETSDDELIDIDEQPQPGGQTENSADRQHDMADLLGSPHQQEDRLLLDDEGPLQEKGQSRSKRQAERKMQSEGEREGDFGPFMEYQKEEAMMTELEEELRMAEAMMHAGKTPAELQPHALLAGIQDQQHAAGPPAPEQTATDADKDDLSMLNEILNAPPTGEEDDTGFTHEWQAVFGAPGMTITPHTVPAERDLSRRQADFMPSMLLDTQSTYSFDGDGGGVAGTSAGQAPPSTQLVGVPSSVLTSQAVPPSADCASGKEQKKDMSAWFSLFADLDPLSNPDAIGRESENVMDNL